MKILLVHNHYGSSAPSGENRVVQDERDLLRFHGHEVMEFFRFSDALRRPGRLRGISGRLRGGFSTPWNPVARSEVRQAVNIFRPDIIHVHNTFPLISPAIFSATRGPAAKVLTLHNYRLFCSAGVPSRDGVVCTECLDRRSVVPALRHGCYRGSRIATIPLAVSIALHRRLGTWADHVDAFILLSEFQRAKMLAAGLRADISYVKANFFPGQPQVIPWLDRGQRVVYVGRLSEEKGVSALIMAWRVWSESGAKVPELRIVGDGPQRAALLRLATGLPISFLGQLSSEAAQSEIGTAKLLVLPSQCFEGSPMVVREAFALGTPAAVSDLGPLPFIVESGVSGLTFKAGDPADIYNVIRNAWDKDDVLPALAQGARLAFEATFTASKNYASLMSIYTRALKTAQSRGESDVSGRVRDSIDEP